MSDYEYTSGYYKYRLSRRSTRRVQRNYNTRNTNKIRRRRRRRDANKNTSNNSQPKTKEHVEEEEIFNYIPASNLQHSLKFVNNINVLTPLEIWSEYVNPHISYSLCQSNTKADRPYIYVSTISLNKFISEIHEQIKDLENQVYCDFNWEKISEVSGLTARACREIWWSIDERIIKICDGYLIRLDMNHYSEIDTKLIIKCRKRIKTLLEIAEKYNLDDIIN